MKKNIKHRIISGVLALVMLISFVPFSGFTSVAADELNLSDNPTQMLGWGYNAITGEEIGVDTMLKNSWIDHDNDATKLYSYGSSNGGGVLKQHGESSFYESSLDYMMSLGIDYSNSTSADFTIKKIKAGVETKFGASFDMSLKQTKDELYYRYIYKAICNHYSMGSEYEKYMSAAFLAEIDKIYNKLVNNESADAAIAAFYEKYGTHMLIAFETGGEAELTAWAISETRNNEFIAELKSSMSGSVGVGEIANAKTNMELGVNFSLATDTSEAETNVYYDVIGGETLYAGVTDPGKIEIDSVNLEEWVESISRGNNVALLPSSTDWISVWELLESFDERYTIVGEKMYEYFVSKTRDKNDAFLKKYCSYSNRIELRGYTYISPNGYVYQNVPFETLNVGNTYQSNNIVAPGSTIIVSKIVDDSVYSIDDISYEIVSDSENGIPETTVDRNGVIYVNDSSGSFKLHMKYGDIVIAIVEFTIEKEGMAGGYGTESRPYLVSNKSHLINIASSIADLSDKHFLLISDIDFNGDSFNGIPSFSGTFDGNGHRIYGFSMNSMVGNNISEYGFVHKNLGTIKNLIIGNNDYNRSDLLGTNKGTGDVTAYSVVINFAEKETVSNRMSVGALVGWNEGVIDNCRVENVYVRGENADTDNNATSYIYVGMVGTNNYKSSDNNDVILGGVITRSVSTNNYFEGHATTKKDSGDNCYSYVGGIAARSSGLISYCISSNNTIRSDARGDGTSKNKAYSMAVAGGIVGRLSNVPDSDSGDSAWQIKNSFAYSNMFSVYVTQTTNSPGTGYTGSLAGEAVANSTDTTLSSVHTDSNSNVYIGKDEYLYSYTPGAHPNAIGSTEISTNNGYTVQSSLDSLKEYSVSVDHEYIIFDGKDLIVSMPTEIIVTGGQQDYVVGDYVNVESMEIKAKYKDDSGLRDFVAYNIETSSFETVIFRQFRLTNFTTESASDGVLTEIRAWNGLISESYRPIVNDVAVEELIITRVPYLKDYYEGAEFNSDGLTLALRYNNGTTVQLDSGYELTGYYSNVIGNQEIEVSYGPKTAYFTVTVHRIKPASLKLLTYPDKTNYAIGESFDGTGMTFNLVYNNGDVEVIGAEDVAVSGFDSSEEGNMDITATYTYYDEDILQNATVNEYVSINIGSISHIEVETLPNKLSYYSSDKKLISDGLSIKVHYSNGAAKTISGDRAIQLSGYDLKVEGIHNVKVEYQGFTDTFEIEVLPVTLSSVEIKTLPKTKFYIPDVMTTSGMVLTLNYVDGSSRDVYDGFITTVEGYEEGKLPQFMTTGTKNVTVAYEENGIRRYTSYDITISHRAVTEIQVVYMPLKQIYKQNEKISTDGLVIYGIYNNGEVFEIKDYTILSVDTSTVGTKTVNIVYMGSYRTSFEITVVAPERIYVDKMPDKSIYTIGETFDPTGLVVKAVYWDYSEVVLNENTYTLSEPALDDYGSEKVNVTYGSLSTSFYVQTMEFEVPEDAPKILIDSVNATIGKTVVVNICIANNPGIASMKLNVDFDETVLTLTDVTYNSEMGGQSQQPQDMTAPLILNWYNGWDDYIGDCIFATLTFEVSENATHNSISYVSVSYDPEDVYNILEENVTYYAEGGVINVIEYVPGDINDDGEVNNKDATRLFQYLSGWDVEVCEKALDVNGDENVNNKDMTRLFQYLSGWDVEIH